MNIEEIKTLLPHRDNMLLIDEVTLEGNKAYGKKTITGDEWFLKGHFPGNPVVPGVILCEILAQSTCACLGAIGGEQLPFFTGLDKVRFKNSVLPGDVFETECEIVNINKPFYFCKGKGTVNGKVCVTAEYSFAVVDKKE